MSGQTLNLLKIIHVIKQYNKSKDFNLTLEKKNILLNFVNKWEKKNRKKFASKLLLNKF